MTPREITDGRTVWDGIYIDVTTQKNIEQALGQRTGERLTGEFYAQHPQLGPRLVESARALLDLPGDDPVAVLGDIDAQKLRSSMTLFAHVAPQEPVFAAVLDRCFGGDEDPLTRELLDRSAPPATG